VDLPYLGATVPYLPYLGATTLGQALLVPLAFLILGAAFFGAVYFFFEASYT
jgi:hypothetical protein